MAIPMRPLLAAVPPASPNAGADRARAGALDAVSRTLDALHDEMIAAGQRVASAEPPVPDARRASAANLLHYLALRRRDLRALQGELAALGLSSLSHGESHALQNLEAVQELLRRIDAVGGVPLGADVAADEGRAELARNTAALLGPAPPGRDVRIMVTLPSEGAEDGHLVGDLLRSGMDCLRINAAHDDADAWLAMVGHLRRAQEDTGRGCRVLMDLAGPRIRTGAIEPGPPVLHWRPVRDVYGRAVRPARVWLTGSPGAAPLEPAAAIVPIDAGWLAGLAIGERLRFEDARGKRRELTVSAHAAGGVWAESADSVYLLPGTRLRRDRGCRGRRWSTVGDLPETAQTLLLRPGDTLILSRGDAPGRPAVCAADGRVLTPAIVGVSLPSIIDDLQAGEPIWFDDGRIGGTVRSVGRDGAEVVIVHARAGASKLGAEKGINLPESTLRLPSLTAKDLDDLRFMVGHADIIGYSFVRTAADVEALQARLAEATTRELGVILKIETRRAFEELPALLLSLMRSPAAGVMIARGDLAVECGFERLAELQEQILSLAEASHVPVIWATQVLETLAKDGIPSRAEITDAAMAERAECVMLNKGPHVLEAVRALDDILRRMQQHQQKKHPMLRALGVAERYLAG